MGIHSTIKKVPEAELGGTVIQTSPTPGNKVVTGDIVTLFVSSGSGKTDTSIPENAQNSAESSDIKLPYSASENALEVIPPSVPTEISKLLDRLPRHLFLHQRISGNVRKTKKVQIIQTSKGAVLKYETGKKIGKSYQILF